MSIELSRITASIEAATDDSIRSRFLNYISQCASPDREVEARKNFVNGITVTLNCREKGLVAVQQLFQDAETTKASS